MDSREAHELIDGEGYSVDSVARINEGLGHFNFEINLKKGDSLVARFGRRDRDVSSDGLRRDFLYNGLISLEREAYAYSLVRDKLSLPAPRIVGNHLDSDPSFLILEKLKGTHWSSFIEQNNYSLEKFLDSLRFLGRDISVFQTLNFDTYGDIMPEGKISPSGITDFSDRLKTIFDLKIKRAGDSPSLNDSELHTINEFVETSISNVRTQLSHVSDRPVFVLADIHPRNFLVDENGKPSGYFDMEYPQAGHPSLELYMPPLQLFNYFDEDTFLRAKDAFYNSYHQSGGRYDPEDSCNQKLELLLGMGHFLSATVSYHGMKDGLRDSWGERFKRLLLNIIEDEKVDHVAFSNIIREKTGQPEKPN